MGLQERNINEHFNKTFHSPDLKKNNNKKNLILNLKQLRSKNENAEHSPAFYMISKSLFIKHQVPNFHSTGAVRIITLSFSARQHCRDSQTFFPTSTACAWWELL